MKIMCTGVGLIAVVALLVSVLFEEWRAALFAAGVVVGDFGLNTYIEALRNKKSAIRNTLWKALDAKQ